MTRALSTAAPVALVALLACASGCASTAGETMRANASTVRAESTPRKLLERGDGFAAVGDMTRAEQYYAAALEGGGDAALLVRRLVRVCVADQRYRVAIEYAENYLRESPRDAEVRFVLATIQAAIGDAESARENLVAVLDLTPNDADVHFALADLSRRAMHDPVQADRHFRAYLRLAPRGAKAEQARGGLMKEVRR